MLIISKMTLWVAALHLSCFLSQRISTSAYQISSFAAFSSTYHGERDSAQELLVRLHKRAGHCATSTQDALSISCGRGYHMSKTEAESRRRAREPERQALFSIC